jgi:hypothetical protein
LFVWVKVKVMVKVTLEQITKFQIGSRGIAPPFLDHGTRRSRGQVKAPTALPPEKYPVPITG